MKGVRRKLLTKYRTIFINIVPNLRRDDLFSTSKVSAYPKLWSPQLYILKTVICDIFYSLISHAKVNINRYTRFILICQYYSHAEKGYWFYIIIIIIIYCVHLYKLRIMKCHRKSTIKTAMLYNIIKSCLYKRL